MTIAELIEFLQGLDNQDRTVVLAKDGEGNGYSPLDGHFEGLYRPTSTWGGDIYCHEEVEDEDWRNEEDFEEVLVLWPTN